jgi:ribose transport system substrate-binding protein
MRRRSFLAAPLAGFATACRRDRARVLGVIAKGANHIFWQSVHAGAIKAARETGYALQWNAPAIEVDASRQIEIVQSMINQRLAGIALAPVDSKALVSVVERAAEVGVPVVIYDSGIDTKKHIGYIATNNYESGRIAAKRLGERMGGKGKAGVVGFMPGSESTMQREQGFIDGIKEWYPGIQVLDVQFNMANRAKALSITENMLAANPDLAGLYADNESSVAGAVQALKSRQARNVILVGMDASEPLVEDLKAGWIDALVLQDPFRMGYESVKALAGHIAGRRGAGYLDTGVYLVRREDLDQPRVRELLFPDIQRWLKGS